MQNSSNLFEGVFGIQEDLLVTVKISACADRNNGLDEDDVYVIYKSYILYYS